MQTYKIHHDSFTGGFADANPTVERLKSLGYRAELVVMPNPNPHVGYNRFFKRYDVATNAPENIYREALGYRYTPEYFQERIAQMMEV